MSWRVHHHHGKCIFFFKKTTTTFFWETQSFPFYVAPKVTWWRKKKRPFVSFFSLPCHFRGSVLSTSLIFFCFCFKFWNVQWALLGNKTRQALSRSTAIHNVINKTMKSDIYFTSLWSYPLRFCFSLHENHFLLYPQPNSDVPSSMMIPMQAIQAQPEHLPTNNNPLTQNLWVWVQKPSVPPALPRPLLISSYSTSHSSIVKIFNAIHRLWQMEYG